MSQFLMTACVFLLHPRRLWHVLLLGACVGVVHTLSFLPISVIQGTADFWIFPGSRVGTHGIDMAQVMTAYAYLVQGPWTVPLLYSPKVLPPTGTHLVWMDPVPSVALIGKLISELLGRPFNPFGYYQLVAFSATGPVMAWLLWQAGARGLAAAFAGAALATAAPYLLEIWQYLPLTGLFLLIISLSLYVMSINQPARVSVSVSWTILLMFMAITNIYMFVMIGGIWAASLAQRQWDRLTPAGHLALEVMASVSGALLILWSLGYMDSSFTAGASDGFGTFSMNLMGPFIPQMSGVFWPLSNYMLGNPEQVLVYLGAGTLLLGVFNVLPIWRWGHRHIRRHAAILVLFAGYCLFALTHRLTFGSRVIFELPLPDVLLQVLGSFRGSGRFFFPVGFAIMAVSVIVVLRCYRPAISVPLLLVAGALQLVDGTPLRHAATASTHAPSNPVLNRSEVAALLSRANAVAMWPRFTCLFGDPPLTTSAEYRRLWQAGGEIHLLAARGNLPINSAYLSRGSMNCAEDRVAIGQSLQPGTAYFYLRGYQPKPEQLSGHDLTQVCGRIDWADVCLIPNR